MKKHLITLQILAFIVLNVVSCKKEQQPSTQLTINRLPVANAGNDQIIVLPGTSVLLNGTSSKDPDGVISEYYWSKISGPNSFHIETSTEPSTQVTSLVEGTYEFKLTVIDNQGFANNDIVKVFVVFPELKNEMIVENLVWGLWHDENDPTGLFDEISITTPRILRSTFNSAFRVFVKTASSPDWVEVKRMISGQFPTPFYYSVYTPITSDSGYASVYSTLLDRCLPGTTASLKINY